MDDPTTRVGQPSREPVTGEVIRERLARRPIRAVDEVDLIHLEAEHADLRADLVWWRRACWLAAWLALAASAGWAWAVTR